MKDERGRRKIAAAIIAAIAIVLAVWFLSIHHHIDVEAEGEGTVSPDGATVGHLGSVTFEFIPADGWTLKEVLLDGRHAELTDGKLVLRWIVSNHSVKAVFSGPQESYSLTVDSDSRGSVSPSGTAVYPAGSEATVIATPDEGCVIDDVKVDAKSVGSRNVITLRMDSDHSVEVVFREAVDDPSVGPVDPRVFIDVDVRAVSLGADYGYVEPSGNVRVACGGALTVMIRLNSGYTLVSVTVDGESRGAPAVFAIENITKNVSADIVISHPAPPPPIATHAVTASATSGGSISPSGTIAVDDGQDLRFAIIPDSGYRLSSLEVDGKSVGTGLDYYILRNITEDHTVRAVFAPSPSPGPTPAGSFVAFVEKVHGTKVGQNGDLVGFEKSVKESLSKGDPFELKNIQPGVHQTADIRLKNETDSTISVKLVLSELSGSAGYEALAKEIIVTIKAGSIAASETLYQLMSSGTWSSAVLTMTSGSAQDMEMTISLPEDAGSGSMGKDLQFRLAIEAFAERFHAGDRRAEREASPEHPAVRLPPRRVHEDRAVLRSRRDRPPAGEDPRPGRCRAAEAGRLRVHPHPDHGRREAGGIEAGRDRGDPRKDEITLHRAVPRKRGSEDGEAAGREPPLNNGSSPAEPSTAHSCLDVSGVRSNPLKKQTKGEEENESTDESARRVRCGHRSGAVRRVRNHLLLVVGLGEQRHRHQHRRSGCHDIRLCGERRRREC